MSDKSYSPGSDSSINDNQNNLEYSSPKKYELRTTGLKRKHRCSSGTEITSTSRNRSLALSRHRSYSASDSHSTGSVTGQLQHRSRSETKLSLALTKVKQLQRTEKTAQIFDIEYFREQLNIAHVCAGGRLKFIPDTETAVGLFHRNSWECSKCHKRTSVANFPPKYPIGTTVQDPNARLYAVSAATGIGYETISTIMASLYLSITTKKHFIEQTHKIHSSLHGFAQEQFQLLINSIRQSAGIDDLDSILNVYVSMDGTWKRRGHVSNYGIVFLIHVETGYCIDYEVLSLRCEACDINKGRLTNKQFESWFQSHKLNCSKNYVGTSKGMEAEGASRIFQRSIRKGLRYKYLVCDGDSSAYDRVKNIYIDHETVDEDDVDNSDKRVQEDNELRVLKVDCINHVKKRVINRLKDIKSRNTGFHNVPQDFKSSPSATHIDKKMKTSQSLYTIGEERQTGESVKVKKTLADGKPFGGSAGRMTEGMMHKMSESYGLAIRQGSNEAKEEDEDDEDAVTRLQRKCLAAFHHLIVHENKEDQHLYCPDGVSSWCTYKRDKATNKNEDAMKNKNRLDPVYRELLQKMINDLTSKELLLRCIRGLTQNSNESLNSVVWSILSKAKQHGFVSVQGAAAAASIYFNGGRASLLEFFEQSGIKINEDLYKNLVAKDEKRVKRAEQTLERRQTLITQKSQQRLQSLQATNDTSEYGSGLF
ncbi:unnamed protein product [Adineta steineri]|uniref:Mutator-like transposase domain-containing protein n=1 Tax=Adineta steineri TaxID=433720 RepID=A0A814MYZ8_9BILA|nr:unnamed protein product [Adineta steineri]CAF1496425.1 unnamed protein product [Adineta steineri]CAF1528176.1 unnamed protein product [Adineta steineri]CAF4188297.1 unnamed protein product [Adineta steineri]CAF4195983.1 unnamed protein product [Adineta steineri]